VVAPEAVERMALTLHFDDEGERSAGHYRELAEAGLRAVLLGGGE
jgi:hypothetical protein